jgi:hypothetical protein
MGAAAHLALMLMLAAVAAVPSSAWRDMPVGSGSAADGSSSSSELASQAAPGRSLQQEGCPRTQCPPCRPEYYPVCGADGKVRHAVPTASRLRVSRGSDWPGAQPFSHSTAMPNTVAKPWVPWLPRTALLQTYDNSCIAYCACAEVQYGGECTASNNQPPPR